LFEEHKLDCPVLLQKEAEVAEVYQANVTPSGYLVSPEGKIVSELAIGADALLELLDGKAESRKQKWRPTLEMVMQTEKPIASVIVRWRGARSSGTV
jgi:hypothetical protein